MKLMITRRLLRAIPHQAHFSKPAKAWNQQLCSTLDMNGIHVTTVSVYNGINNPTRIHRCGLRLYKCEDHDYGSATCNGCIPSNLRVLFHGILRFDKSPTN
jgi:hypothetical protein